MKKKAFGCLGIFLIVALGVSLIFNFLLLVAGVDSPTIGASGPVEIYDKVRLSGSGGNQVAVIPLYGVISYGMPGDAFASMVDDIVAKLKQAREDSQVKAIILRVDSPGGEVTASDVIYNEVVKTDAVKPVVVFMESVAASGGYYVAVGGRHLMANELSITGSIGVILQTYNMTGLSEKVGLDVLTIKSGKMKDILNPFRKVEPEEVEFVQELINETYGKFLGIVADERDLDAEELRDSVADGRILSGKRALDAGLIDSTGYFDDATSLARELAGIEKASVVELQAPVNLGRLFRIFGSSMQSKNQIELRLGPESLQLESGKLYYLSPHLYGN